MIFAVCYNCVMTLPSLWQPSTNYKISTEVYEGPLDLLLQLIEQAELDITKLSLAKVTDEYLAHLNSITQRDPTEVSAFLVIAAKLVLIKSSILLPSLVGETMKLKKISVISLPDN